MTFGEKLLKLRTEKKWSQVKAAERCGLSRRKYISYEVEGRYPRDRAVYAAIADAFECSKDYLLTENEEFISSAAEKYGYRGKKQAEELVAQLAGMFAGGEMPDEDKDAVMNALQRAYVMSKEINKKYTPMQYRTEETED